MVLKLPPWNPPTNTRHPLFGMPPQRLQLVERPSDVKKYCPRIPEETAAEIHRLYKIKGMTKLAISQKLGVSRSTVIRYLGQT